MLAADIVALNRLLAQALDLAPAARQAWLLSLALPPEHEPLRPTLQRLLVQADSAAGAETADLLPPLFTPDTFMALGTEAGYAAGARIGPYTLLRPLGRGGMGVVWLAERSDGELKRPVALKLPLIASHPVLLQRLARERDILGALVHPHIARLYDAGVDLGGQPYLALEYVDGQALDAWCAAHAAPLRERLALFLQVARAVAYAHANLVLHRDLKPSNILVTAQGQVRLLDFGIAKLLDSDATQATELTQIAGAALTLDYASPEQIAGRPLTVASDVYTLGVVLCELLCGQRPYRLERKTRGALEDAITVLEPSAPSSLTSDRALRRQLAGDLDTIVLKALKKTPAERYATADALADDIERHLAGLPVQARPDAAWYRSRKFVSRHRWAVAGGAAVAVSLLAGSGVALWQARQAQQAARQALAVQGFMSDVFRASTYDQPDPLKAQSTTARELLAAGTRKIDTALDDAPDAKIEVLRTLGALLLEFDLDDEAAKLQRRRVALLRTRVGPHDPGLAQALTDLAAALEAASARADRRAVLEEAQHIVDQQTAPAQALQAALHYQWARALQYVDWPASARHADAAAALFRTLDDKPHLMSALWAAGVAADESDQPELAERHLAQSLAVAHALPRLPPELPDILLQLAEIQAQRMELAEADGNFRASMAQALQIFGRDHDSYVRTLVSYAVFLSQSSRLRDALPLLREAAQTQQRTKGDNEAFHLPRTLSMLGVVLADYGQAEEGAEWLDRVVRLKLQGPQNLAVAAYLNLAARVHADAGHMARAAALLDQAGRIVNQQPAASSREAVAKHHIERARWALRAAQPARALAQLTPDIIATGAVPNSRATLGDHVFLAEVQAASGDWPAAEASARRARQAIEQLHIAPAALRENARLDVLQGRLQLTHGDAAAASALLRHALALRNDILDPQSPLRAEALAYLARARRAAGDEREAALLLSQARKALGAHPALPPSFAALASAQPPP